MRSLIALFALCSIAPAAAAAAQSDPPNGKQYRYVVTGVVIKRVVVTQVIPLRYASASSVAQRLRGRKAGAEDAPGANANPAGIDSIVEDARTNSLVITGSSDAMPGVIKRIAALDVKPRVIMLTFSVLRFDFDADGEWDVRVVSRPVIKTIDDSPATISISGTDDAHAAEIKPHVNADGTFALEGALVAAGQRSTFKRNIASRTKAILTGVTDAASASLRRTVAAGRIPSAKGERFTVFYLQLVSVQED